MTLLCFFGCIPMRVAPHIEGDKLVKAKRFKKGLPKRYGLVFEDPKSANEFYRYVNTKFQCNDNYVQSNVPFKLGERTYYFSFYEVERITETANLVPMIADAALVEKGMTPVLESIETSRMGRWYIVLMASDDNGEDLLNPNYANRNEIINYLRSLRIEYLNTSNYLELLFMN